MRERHWTIPQLAEACDVATGLAQKWVSVNPRYRSTPSPASCEKIAAALSIDADRILELAGHRKPGEPRAEIDAMRQARREQLEAWVTAVGPENEAYFWSHLTAQAESTARLILELKTAVNQPAGTAVSGAVSDPPKRPRRGRRGTEGPLTVDLLPLVSRLGASHSSVDRRYNLVDRRRVA